MKDLASGVQSPRAEHAPCTLGSQISNATLESAIPHALRKPFDLWVRQHDVRLRRRPPVAVLEGLSCKMQGETRVGGIAVLEC